MPIEKRSAWWIACVGGAVGALVVHGLATLVSAAAEPVVRDDPGLAPRAAPNGADADRDAATLRSLVTEVAALRERLLASPNAGTPERTSATAPAPGLDEASLVAALRRVNALADEERYAALTDGELYGEAERLLRADAMDRLSSRRMLQSLLARPAGSTTPELRADTLMLLAQVQRDLHDLPGAAAALQRVVDELGLASDRGARAGNQLALLAAHTKDYPAGIAIAQHVARVAPLDQAFEARWGIGFLQRMSGDVAAARATLRQLIDDCAGRPELEHFAKMGERELATMER